VTKREYVDLPPRPATNSMLVSYVYYVTGTTTKGTVLRSNMIVVVVLPTPVPKDVVRITSTPTENGQVNIEYKYQVKANSSDSSARLSYILNSRPNGMTIDSTGLIKWTPRERGFPVVEVTVKSNKGGSASQRFTIRVAGGSGIVLGTVTDTTGTKPIAMVVIRLLRAGLTTDPATSWSFDYKAITDASGKYKMDDVDPGSYYVRAEPVSGDYLAEWYDGASSQRDAKIVVVSNNAPTPVDFTLQSRYKPVYYTVKGNVIDSASHAPMKDAAVNFVLAGFALNGGKGFAADPTLAQDFRGMFDFNQSIDHRLDGTNVQFVFKARTDFEGKFSLKLPPGSFLAFAEAKGHIKIFYKQTTNLLLADTIRVNGSLEGINFNLPPVPQVPLGEINGVISDSATGRGVRSRVLVYRETWTRPEILILPDKSYVPKVYIGDTDSLGKYSIVNIVPGQYVVLAVPMGSYVPAFYSTSGSTQSWRQASKVSVNGNVVAGIDITVKPFVKMMVGYTFVSGTVTTNAALGKLGKSSATIGVAGAIVYATNANGSYYGYDITDEKGSYAITGAAPGSYDLFVDAPGFESSSSRNASPSYASDAKGSPQGALGVNFNLGSFATSAGEDQPMVPNAYVLEQNYPNPFNPTTQILFSLPNSERVTLTVYNLIGQKVATLVDGPMSAGSHLVKWSGRDSHGLQLPSGIYFYRLQSPSFTAARKMLMLK
jgi:hypothetical protein